MTDGARPQPWFNKKKDRSFPWFCVNNTFPGHRKWRFLSKALGIHIAFVEVVMIDILAHANRNDDGKARGSLEGWSADVCAAMHDLDPNDCSRIYAKLEEIGDIDQDYFVNWDRHQLGKPPDPTAAQRQQRVRDKKNAKKKALRAAAGSPQIAVHAAEIERTFKNDDEQVLSQYWLETSGKQIVLSRLGMRALAAQMTIENWRKECLKDSKQLVLIISAADRENLSGDQFRNWVGQQVAQYKTERTRGPALPFPVVAIQSAPKG